MPRIFCPHGQTQLIKYLQAQIFRNWENRKNFKYIDGLIHGRLQGNEMMESHSQTRTFYVADLNTRGELRQVTDYDYLSLEQIPGASDLIARCSGAIWKSPDEMQVVLNDELGTWIRWRSTAPSAGVATVRRLNGDLVSLSLLAAGLGPEAEATTLEVYQQHLVRELKQTPFEPAFDLLQIKQRPLLATVTFTDGATDSERMVEALADRCFAAAYFRYLRLA
jgi:hypothetical protein